MSAGADGFQTELKAGISSKLKRKIKKAVLK